MIDVHAATEKLSNLEANRATLQASKCKAIEEKKDQETRMSELNGRIRGMGTLLQDDYEAICQEQKRTKQNFRAIELLITSINTKLVPIYAQEVILKRQIKTATPPQNVHIINGHETVVPILKQLRVLRGKYTRFSEDPTRIGQMKTMASQFSDDLTDILMEYEEDEKT